MNPIIREFLESDEFTSLDREVASLVGRLTEGNADLTSFFAALLSRAIRNSDVCLNLNELHKQSIPESVPLPGPDCLEKELAQSKVVGGPASNSPLILDANNRLYLNRYFRYEERLANHIKSRISYTIPLSNKICPEELVRIHFPAESDIAIRKAIENALIKPLSLISGGPGTGKTWTVARLLEFLLSLEAPNSRPIRIGLSAPTGKAANRLNESLQDIVSRLPNSPKALTLHNLLGLRPDTPPIYNSKNPLPLDFLIIDEASMVDLAMMTKVFDALEKNTRLILLGDKDQLASVEAGSVISDICMVTKTKKEHALTGNITHYSKNYRFRPSSIIQPLCEAIREGRTDDALALLKSTGTLRPLETPSIFKENLLEMLRPWKKEMDPLLNTPSLALKHASSMKILCVRHKGLWGTEHLNGLCKGLNSNPGVELSAGDPLMILQNDYTNNLFNGDSGVVLYNAQTHAHSACFPDSIETSREFSLGRLPQHTLAYAISVHKSQGSEYQTVHLVLPQAPTELLTRELIYTAVTRARETIIVWGDETILRYALNRRTIRQSGLTDRLLRD